MSNLPYTFRDQLDRFNHFYQKFTVYASVLNIDIIITETLLRKSLLSQCALFGGIVLAVHSYIPDSVLNYYMIYIHRYGVEITIIFDR